MEIALTVSRSHKWSIALSMNSGTASLRSAREVGTYDPATRRTLPGSTVSAQKRIDTFNAHPSVTNWKYETHTSSCGGHLQMSHSALSYAMWLLYPTLPAGRCRPRSRDSICADCSSRIRWITKATVRRTAPEWRERTLKFCLLRNFWKIPICVSEKIKHILGISNTYNSHKLCEKEYIALKEKKKISQNYARTILIIDYWQKFLWYFHFFSLFL